MDENGNEIGREEHDPGQGFGGSPEHFTGDEGDHLPTVLTLNVAKIIEIHNINTNKGKDSA